MKRVTLPSRAKINLTLDVLKRREDGYHEIESIMQSIDLQDSLTLERTKGEWDLIAGDSRLPQKEKNLAWRAGRLMFDHFQLTGGLRIYLEKKIPLAAGLGGGSANAATVMKGIVRLFGLGPSLQDLAALAGRLGADVPFFLTGGTAVASGRGEQIEPLQDLPVSKVTLVLFPFGLSTPAVYKAWWGAGPLYRTRRALPYIKAGAWQSLWPLLGNDLEPGACSLSPLLNEVLSKLRSVEDARVHVSGSGPTVVVYRPVAAAVKDVLLRYPVEVVEVETVGKENQFQ